MHVQTTPSFSFIQHIKRTKNPFKTAQHSLPYSVRFHTQNGLKDKLQQGMLKNKNRPKEKGKDAYSLLDCVAGGGLTSSRTRRSNATC